MNQISTGNHRAAKALDRRLNDLFDALALVRALIDRLPDRTDDENSTVRIAQMAAEKLAAATEDFAEVH